MPAYFLYILGTFHIFHNEYMLLMEPEKPFLTPPETPVAFSH